VRRLVVSVHVATTAEVRVGREGLVAPVTVSVAEKSPLSARQACRPWGLQAAVRQLCSAAVAVAVVGFQHVRRLPPGRGSREGF
jgi:hypothetical protein